jgi:ribosomal protein S18 acetylase RimI-like enzyme
MKTVSECKVNFVDNLSEEVEEEMRKDLVDYESSHGINVNYRKFAVVLTDDANNTLGVINAFTAFAEVYIDDMWVNSLYRGMGYGRKLLQALETHFQGKGFNNINLVTNAFNAPEFYKKCGFTAEFVRKNIKNPQLTKTFFVKFFDDEIQTQGILK